MNPELTQPPPKLWKVFAWVYWSLIGLTCIIVLFFMLILFLLAVAVAVSFVAGLVT